jgi:iron(III) transport system ATP-binding protein
VVQEATPEELYHRPVSPEVAEFVGDAQFVPGEASGRRVATGLGDLPVAGNVEGAVSVMLRPEMLRLVPRQEGEGTNGTVLTREFYGHDQLMRVQLDNGTVLRARLGSYGGIRPGDNVLVSVRGAVLTFPRESDKAGS